MTDSFSLIYIFLYLCLFKTINDLTDSLQPELDQIKKMIEDDVEEKILLMQGGSLLKIY